MVLAVAAISGRPAQAGGAEEAMLSVSQRAWIASRVYAAVQSYFGHWRGVPGLDFDEEYRVYLDRILASGDRRAFDLATMALVARLGNGHSGFGDGWLREAFGQPLGFAARPIGGKWVVTASDVGGLRPGDVLAKIDGRPFEEFADSQEKYVSASDQRWRHRALFESPYLFPAAFALELGDGRKVPVTRRGVFRWPGEEEKETTFREEGDVLVVRVPSFARPTFEAAALEALRGHPSAKALIFDVRGNHGGSTPEKLVAALMDRPYRWYAESTPVAIGLFQFLGIVGRHAELAWSADVEKPAPGGYRGMLLLLVDGGCFSACEDFAVPFKDNHRALLLGERTAGSSGQPASLDLGDGMSISLSAKREFLPDGSDFEGVGIAPDVEIPVSAADLSSRADRILDEARRRARQASRN
jgi:carboxyl-terminal processing protease